MGGDLGERMGNRERNGIRRPEEKRREPRCLRVARGHENAGAREEAEARNHLVQECHWRKEIQ